MVCYHTVKLLNEVQPPPDCPARVLHGAPVKNCVELESMMTVNLLILNNYIWLTKANITRMILTFSVFYT